jgi:hypothetical protein
MKSNAPRPRVSPEIYAKREYELFHNQEKIAAIDKLFEMTDLKTAELFWLKEMDKLWYDP